MKILFLTATYLPTVNGVSHQIKQLTQVLRAQGHQVLIFAPSHPEAVPDPGLVRYPAYITPLARDYPLGIPLRPPPALINFQPDVIHTHHPFHIGRLALRLGARLHRPVFFTHHTQYRAYAATYLPWFRRPVQSLLQHHLDTFCRQTTRVICPSPTVRLELRHHGIRQVVVIRNGINLTEFTPAAVPPPPLKLIYAGRLSREKNLIQLLRFFQSLHRLHPSAHLTLAGSGNQEPSLKELSRHLGLKSAVNFTGLVAPSRLPNLLRRHHFFISLSRTEVLPLSFIEAQACGLPLILSRDSPRDPAFNSTNCLFLPPSPTVASAQVSACFDNRPRYIRLRRQALVTATGFDINLTATSHLKLYYRCLNHEA